jgi:hypothetical protein
VFEPVRRSGRKTSPLVLTKIEIAIGAKKPWPRSAGNPANMRASALACGRCFGEADLTTFTFSPLDCPFEPGTVLPGASAAPTVHKKPEAPPRWCGVPYLGRPPQPFAISGLLVDDRQDGPAVERLQAVFLTLSDRTAAASPSAHLAQIGPAQATSKTRVDRGRGQAQPLPAAGHRLPAYPASGAMRLRLDEVIRGPFKCRECSAPVARSQKALACAVIEGGQMSLTSRTILVVRINRGGRVRRRPPTVAAAPTSGSR